MDESGHDHRNMPYEVRGGVVLHAAKLWSFIQAWRRLELDLYGAELTQYRKEIKGCKLLDKDRIGWAGQDPYMPDEERRKHCRAFFTKGLQIFLFERYFYFLEEKNEDGLIVMDESDKQEDRRFVRRMYNYFLKTAIGRYRTSRIVPVPFFVASDMAIPVQAADLCVYAINWGFRIPKLGMTSTERLDVKRLADDWISRLQYHGEGCREGTTFKTHGIVYVPDPYESRE